MPSSPGYKRDYVQERKTESPERKKKRADRNKARRKLMKEGKVRKGDNRDVDHKNGNARDNSRSNLRAVPASKNRSYARTKTAGKKNKRA
jgi:hypothetical protein